MKLKKQYVLVLALLVLTAVLAVYHLTTRNAVPENAVCVSWAGKTTCLDVTKLHLEPVQGTVVNGKGQKSAIDAMGIRLLKVLEAAKVDADAVGAVTVTAQDAFAAELTGDEVREDGKAYLIFDKEEATLIVFGDTNSKRKVHQVMQIDVR